MEHINRLGLHHISFQTYNRDMHGVLSLLGFGPDGEPGGGRDEIELNLNPPYQRGGVWGLARRRTLIRSLIEGVPFGAVFLNRRSIMEPYTVVDGKQRIEAFAAFLEGAFTVPAAWWDSDKVFLSDPEIRAHFLDPAGEIGFADLNERGKRWFMTQPFPTCETAFPTEEAERDLFERINFFGVVQGEVDNDLL